MATKKRTPEEAFEAAKEAAGNLPKLAKALGVSRQALYKRTTIPDRFAKQVEELYGIPRAEIAPHLYD